jgi:hypothetical protein
LKHKFCFITTSLRYCQAPLPHFEHYKHLPTSQLISLRHSMLMKLRNRSFQPNQNSQQLKSWRAQRARTHTRLFHKNYRLIATPNIITLIKHHSPLHNNTHTTPNPLLLPSRPALNAHKKLLYASQFSAHLSTQFRLILPSSYLHPRIKY